MMINLPPESSLIDLNEVYSELMEASNNWFNLGLALKIDHSTLDNLSTQHHENKTRLREMLAIWFTSRSAPLTWDHLCKCLRENTVKRIDIAERIEKKYGGN